MSEPFNKEARKRALDLWEVDGDIIHRMHRLESILRDGNMDEHDEARALIFDLQIFADGLKNATDTLGEEDS